MNAATVYGGAAVQKDIARGLRAVLGLLVLLVAFSRIYLGVHTPQDILAGIVAGTLVMYLTMKLTQWVKDHPEKDLLLVCIGGIHLSLDHKTLRRGKDDLNYAPRHGIMNGLKTLRISTCRIA